MKKYLLLCLLLCSLLTSCNKKEPKTEVEHHTPIVHEHSWDQGKITKEATCILEGIKTYTCRGCEDKKEEKIPALGHNYSTDWLKNSENHWHECACGDIKDHGSHTYTIEVIKEATDTETGIKKFSCEICGYSYEEEIQISYDEKLKDVVFEGLKVIYDGQNHSIYLYNLPDGFTVEYTGNNVKEVGKHSVTAKIYFNLELVLELTEVLEIVDSSDVELPLV